MLIILSGMVGLVFGQMVILKTMDCTKNPLKKGWGLLIRVIALAVFALIAFADIYFK